MEQNQSFPLEKILTSSAREYVDMQEKYIKDYNASGVHIIGQIINGLNEYDLLENFRLEFSKKVPPHTEVIVDYRMSICKLPIGQYSIMASGTALIPK